MKNSFMVCACVVLICLGLTLAVRAVTVTSSEGWYVSLGPSGSLTDSFTCIAYFIPDVPDIPVTLKFESEKPPAQTGDYLGGGWWEDIGWESTLSDDGKIAYMHGPRQTNSDPSWVKWFSYYLYYEWDDEDENYDPDYPVYQDVAIFDGQTLVWDESWRGTPGDGWYGPDDDTWKEKAYPGSDPYENPVPGPATIALFGLGAALLRKRR
jgi:hypothetical protein